MNTNLNNTQNYKKVRCRQINTWDGCSLAKDLSRDHTHTLLFSILDYNTFRIGRKTNVKPTIVVYLTLNSLGIMEFLKHKFALLADSWNQHRMRTTNTIVFPLTKLLMHAIKVAHLPQSREKYSGQCKTNDRITQFICFSSPICLGAFKRAEINLLKLNS